MEVDAFMNTMRELSPQYTARILTYLGIPAQSPSPSALQMLLDAYVRRIPWESVSRIVHYHQYNQADSRVRWPGLFWQFVIEQGMGGTCFESNYAFFTLLKHLGYNGYLTLNDMGESTACHTAIVIEFSDQKYLADVGIPIHGLLPLSPNQKTVKTSLFHTYTATPQGDRTYIIERDNHPKPYCFTLFDTPVSDDVYRQALIRDYCDDGLFLDRVIIVRIVDEVIWRFSGGEKPYRLENFSQEGVIYLQLGTDLDQVAVQVADKFEMDTTLVGKALQLCLDRA